MLDNLDGNFKDFRNKKSTDSIEEWWKYCSETEMKYEGVKSCDSCGKPGIKITFKGKLDASRRGIPPAFCEDCKNMLGDGNA